MRERTEMMVGQDEDRPGLELVPGYRLLARLGSGGAGEVWSAEAPGGLRVALKIVHLTGGLGRREVSNVRILRAVRHPNLLAYFGAWQHRGRLVIGMELADESLWDRLNAARGQGLAGIPLGDLLEIMGDVAKVVDFLNEPRHELEGRSGVAIHHRDIKPQNIMLIGRGVKVADFGLSCADDPAGVSRSQCGLTFAYAAPETFRRLVATSSDQYSVAITYCQLRGGRLPFVGPPAAVMMGHLFGEPDLSMLPEAERPIIARAMAKDCNDRWPDCRSLVRELVGCAEAGAPDTLPGGPECSEGLFESSASVEIPPWPAGGDGLASATWDGSTGMVGGTDVSVYCLESGAPHDSGADDREGASATPTILIAERPAPEPRRSLSRLGFAAASILAAGLAIWSSSELIATRADIHLKEYPLRTTSARTTAPLSERSVPRGWDHSPALAPLAHGGTTASAPRAETAPLGSAAPNLPVASAPTPSPAADSEHRPDRTFAGPMRALVAARLAGIAAWEPMIQKASGTAETWLARLSTERGPAMASRQAVSTAPTPPETRAVSPPERDAGLPELLEIEAGRSVSIPIRVDGTKHLEPLSLHFEGVPTGVAIPDVTVPIGDNRAIVVARARLDAPATTATVAMTLRAGSTRADTRLRIRVRANAAMLHRTRGHTLLACGRHAEAVAAFTEAIQAGVSDARVYHNRGLAYSALNQLDPAIRDYTEAIRLDPTGAAIRYDRGLAYARRGDDFRALLDLDTAIRLKPGDIRAYEARAGIYQRHGDMVRSCADSGRAADLARAARPGGEPPAPRPPQSGAANGVDGQGRVDHPASPTR